MVVNPLESLLAHLDMDCFYAQVEHVRLNIPKDVPLAVQQWNGLIAVNYAARDYGVRRGMRVKEAQEICPTLRCVHVAVVGLQDTIVTRDEPLYPDREKHKASLDRYRSASDQVLGVVGEHYGKSFERASIDEVYIDCCAAVKALVQSVFRRLSDTLLSLNDAIPQKCIATDCTTKKALEPPQTEDAIVDAIETSVENEDWKTFCAQCPLWTYPPSVISDLSRTISESHVDPRALACLRIWLSWLDSLFSAVLVKGLNCRLIEASEPIYFTEGTLNVLGGLARRLFDPLCQGVLAPLSLSNDTRLAILRRVGNKQTSWRSFKTQDLPLMLAALGIYNMRQALENQLQYTASAGIARNKFLAKEVSAKNKPNAQTLILEEDVSELLRCVKIKDARGLRGKAGDFVVSVLPDIDVVADIQEKYTLEQVCRAFRNAGGDERFAAWVYELGRGPCREPIRQISRAKSMLACKTFSSLTSDDTLKYWIAVLSSELSRRLEVEFCSAKRIPKTLVVHHTGGTPLASRTRSAPAPYNDTRALSCPELIAFTTKILKTRLASQELYPCTRLGVGATDLFVPDTLRAGQTSLNNFRRTSITLPETELGAKTLEKSFTPLTVDEVPPSSIWGAFRFKRRRRPRRLRCASLTVCHYPTIQIPQKP